MMTPRDSSEALTRSTWSTHLKHFANAFDEDIQSAESPLILNIVCAHADEKFKDGVEKVEFFPPKILQFLDKDAMHIFYYNDDVNDHNEKMLKLVFV